MNPEKNTGQDNMSMAAPDSTQKESKRSEKRASISAKHRNILDFLCACSPYEADSIRVMVLYAMGTGGIEKIPPVDMTTVNRFLNTGIDRQNGVSAENVRNHRQQSAQKLMQAVKEFLNIDRFCRVSAAVMQITHDGKSIEDCVKYLQQQSSVNGAGNQRTT